MIGTIYFNMITMTFDEFKFNALRKRKSCKMQKQEVERRIKSGLKEEIT